MKIKHLILAVVAVAATLTACEKEPSKAYLTVKPEELSFEEGADSKSVSIKSNRTWNIVDSDKLPEWLTVIKKSNGVEVSVTENTDYNRSAEVSFRVVGIAKTLKVTQKGPKGAPLINETFASSLGDFTTKDEGDFKGVWTYSSTYKCALATAFVNQVNNASESWLISPEVDLTGKTTVYLSFEYAANYFSSVDKFKQECTVKITQDNGDTWEDLTLTKYPETLSFTWINSYNIDLKSYLGSKVKIAFVYTSTTDKAGTWEIRNVLMHETAKEEKDTTPEEFKEVSISEFLAAEVSSTQWYKLTGTITNIGRKDWGNLTITDEGASVYIYGLVAKYVESNDKSFASLGLAVNDVVTLATLRAEYNGTAQGGGTPPAFYISHKKGETPSEEPDGSYFVKVTSAENLSGKYLLCYEKSTTEAFVFNGADSEGNYETKTISAQGIASSPAVQKMLMVEIAAMEGGYSVKTATGQYIGGLTANSNGIQMATDPVLNTFKYEDGFFVISSNSKQFVYNNATTSGNRFRYYKEATVTGSPKQYNKLSLYKLSEN